MNSKINWKCYGSATLGERGQIVIPIGARGEFKLEAGDKLLVFGGVGDAIGLNSLILIKADALSEFISKSMDELSDLMRTLEDLNKVEKTN